MTVARGVLVEGGIGEFFQGPYIEESFSKVGSSNANYCYVQCTLNF